MGNHVFICYAREDEQFVLTLAGHLKSQGVPIWLDRWDIPAGVNWPNSIDRAIQGCAKFLIVLSPAAVASEEVQGELRTALDDQKPIIPVLYRDCRIPPRLRSLQYIDFTTSGRNTDDILSQFAQDLGGQQADVVEPPPRSEPVSPPRSVPSKTPPSQASLRSKTEHNWVWRTASILIGLICVVWLFVSTKGTDMIVCKDGKAMVSLPAGEFFMGCNEIVDQECEEDE